MNTSGYSNQMPVKCMEKGGVLEVKRVGPIVQYRDGGMTYTNKKDEKTKIKHQ